MDLFFGLLVIVVAAGAFGYGFYWGIRLTRPLEMQFLFDVARSMPLGKVLQTVTVWWLRIFAGLIVGIVFLLPLQLVALVIERLR